MINIYETLKQRLKPVECNHINSDSFPHCDLNVNLTKCAILILLCRKDHQFHIVFTTRSLSLKSFSGEICFPGGKFDHNLDTTFEDTALREANEEIGLSTHNVKIVTKLCPFPTIVGHSIVPVVGIVCNQNGQFENTYELIKNLKPNPDEVQSIFTIPFNYFCENLNSETFNLMYEKFDEKFFAGINLLEEFKFKKPTEFYRLFIAFDETVFTPLNGTLPYIYGFNGFMLLLVLFLIEDDQNLQLRNKNIILSKHNICSFIDEIRKCSFLLFIKEKVRKSKL